MASVIQPSTRASKRRQPRERGEKEKERNNSKRDVKQRIGEYEGEASLRRRKVK